MTIEAIRFEVDMIKVEEDKEVACGIVVMM